MLPDLTVFIKIWAEIWLLFKRSINYLKDPIWSHSKSFQNIRSFQKNEYVNLSKIRHKIRQKFKF